jgi:hypothetical protein
LLPRWQIYRKNDLKRIAPPYNDSNGKVPSEHEKIKVNLNADMLTLILLYIRNAALIKIPVNYTAAEFCHFFTKGSCFENMGDNKLEAMGNKLLEKHLIINRLMRYCLPNSCKRQHDIVRA